MRTASIKRKTSETDIAITLNLDGTGKADIETGIGFLDHMLKSFAKHGFFDLTVKVKGDLYVDCHHTIEDTGIVLGEAIKEALGDKKSIKRYGSMLLPMDETLVLCAIDNNHHIIEAMFKAFAKAIDEAVSIDPRIIDVLSTKGAL